MKNVFSLPMNFVESQRDNVRLGSGSVRIA
jgi:hypothetical protein